MSFHGDAWEKKKIKNTTLQLLLPATSMLGDSGGGLW